MPGPLRWAQSAGADCEKCPLLDCVPIPPEWPSEPNPEIFIVGDNPTSFDTVLSRPITDMAGMYLNDRFSEFSKFYEPFQRKRTLITNALACKPLPHFKPAQFKKALKFCSGRLRRELEGVPQGGLVLLLGARAIQAVCGKGTVVPWRGYPLEPTKDFKFLADRGAILFPMLHPESILKRPQDTYIFRVDLMRALQWHAKELSAWDWGRLVVDEGPEMLGALEELAGEPWLGYDVETMGLNPFVDDLTCLGFASPTLSVSVPWPARDPQIDQAARALLANPRIGKVLHNASHDMISTISKGMAFEGEVFDTLIAHRIVAPQLRHDLGLVASLEVGGPRWKTLFRVMDDSKGGEKFRKAVENPTTWRELREYNAKDASQTVKLREPLLRRLGEMA